MMKQITDHSRSNISEKQQGGKTNRGGSVVLIPMICLVLSLTIIGELLKQSSIEIKQLKKEQYRLQSIWLADAAAQRAITKLSNQTDYDGEIWTLLPEDIGGEFPGEVLIEIDRSIQKNNSIIIRTTASYPAKSTERVRIIREWPFQLRIIATKN
ncbi:hypothetical protein [Gimesia aquarii]|uniref:Uncharacterized protein n=1 Tax=Gimesia aquarii TaxID=2527964 RepID=A0A517WNG8_9PLAN|nr:hypothetical protein [Gimesia aquarii]QDU06807.1 hypothetical protein V202x_01500 [Gimesia aquarii]